MDGLVLRACACGPRSSSVANCTGTGRAKEHTDENKRRM
jgi:hypothetical protein